MRDYLPTKSLTIQRASRDVVRLHISIQYRTVSKRAIAQVHRRHYSEDIYLGFTKDRSHLRSTVRRRVLEVIPKHDGPKLDVLTLRCTAAGIQNTVLLIPCRRCEIKTGRASIAESGLSCVVAAGRRQVQRGWVDAIHLCPDSCRVHCERAIEV